MYLNVDRIKALALEDDGGPGLDDVATAEVVETLAAGRDPRPVFEVLVGGEARREPAA